MTVKDDRGPKQDLDSHESYSFDSRSSVQPLPDHRDTSDTSDSRSSNSILDSVELLQTEPDSPGSLPTVRGGSDNWMEPVATAPSRSRQTMSNWKLMPGDLKRYPHFDQILRMAEIRRIVTDPVRVAQNQFYPFLRYSKTYKPFRHNPASGKKRKPPKVRPIRYAARRDSYIFAYYRYLLTRPYEAELERLQISQCPVAYRRIPTESDPRRGKCNIHFAREAFDRIRELGECCAIAIDISNFFESIDHEKLKSLWCRMLGVVRLPADHFAVFKNITQYRFVEKLEVYERLGFYGEKSMGKNGEPVKGYLKPFKEIPTQLCTPYDFRQKVLGENGQYKSIVNRNEHRYGIPQGAPISDLLANLYLIDFDTEINELTSKIGGTYMRYSDDILLILPISAADATSIMATLPAIIKKYGDEMLIKPEKCSVVQYSVAGDRQISALISGKQGKQGLEYLGFRYDGKNVYLRNTTVSNLHRKVASAARNQAEATVKRYPGKSAAELHQIFNFEQFTKRFGRVEGFDGTSSNKKWTFWTYVSRACAEFAARGETIRAQVARLRGKCRIRVDQEIEYALQRRAKRLAACP